MLSSLLWFGGIGLFFFFMMRFGCGSHVMGHGKHGHGGGESSDDGKEPRADTIGADQGIHHHG